MGFPGGGEGESRGMRSVIPPPHPPRVKWFGPETDRSDPSDEGREKLFVFERKRLKGEEREW